MKKKEEFKCPHCERIIKSKRGLQVHIEAKHPETLNKSELDVIEEKVDEYIEEIEEAVQEPEIDVVRENTIIDSPIQLEIETEITEEKTEVPEIKNSKEILLDEIEEFVSTLGGRNISPAQTNKMWEFYTRLTGKPGGCRTCPNDIFHCYSTLKQNIENRNQ